MESFLSETEVVHLTQAFLNFQTVLENLPFSQTRDFLLFGVSYLLEKFSDYPVSRGLVIEIIRDMNRIIVHSSVVLDIDDILKQVNMAALVCLPDERYARAH